MTHPKGPKAPLSDTAAFVQVCIALTDEHLIKVALGLELGIRILQSKSYGFVRDKNEEKEGVGGQESMHSDQ